MAAIYVSLVQGDNGEHKLIWSRCRPRRLASSEAAYLSSLAIMRTAVTAKPAKLLGSSHATPHNPSLRIIHLLYSTAKGGGRCGLVEALE
jgi:hypothetical protein